jgi:hypothetical protein
VKDGVEQDDLANFFLLAGWAGEGAALEEFLAKLGAEEAASACYDYFHARGVDGEKFLVLGSLFLVSELRRNWLLVLNCLLNTGYY